MPARRRHIVSHERYYYRKMAEGKKTFSVINAMRNKIILRVFAVVRNKKEYVAHLNLKPETSV